MLINIRTITNRTYNVDIELTDTVLSMKKMIEQQYNIPVENQRIICCGKELLNNDILEDHEVNKIPCLHLIIKINVCDTHLETPTVNV